MQVGTESLHDPKVVRGELDILYSQIHLIYTTQRVGAVGGSSPDTYTPGDLAFYGSIPMS